MNNYSLIHCLNANKLFNQLSDKMNETNLIVINYKLVRHKFSEINAIAIISELI